MPNALTFIIGADSQPFAKEMRQMEQIAATSGARVGARFAEGSAHGSYSGIIRESITIAREAIEGRGAGRIIGSSTLLLQYLKNLVSGSKEAGGAAHAASEAYEVMAFRQQVAANATAKLATSLVAEVDADAGASEASIANALAATEQAAAQNSAALAFRNKASAAAQAAEVEATEAAIAQRSAGSSFLSLGIGGGTMLAAGIAAVAAVTAIVYERWVGIKNVINEAGMKLAESGNDYIPKMERRTAEVEKSAEGIAKAIERAKEAYSGANAEAERQSKILTEQYSTVDRLNQLKKEAELARSKNPEERATVEKKYADIALETDRKKHADELQAMQAHSRNLKADADAALEKRTGPGTLPTAQEDQALERQLQIQKKAAEEFLNKGGGFGDEFKKQAAELFGSTTPTDRKNIEAAIHQAEDQGEVGAQAMIKRADDEADKIQERNKARAENERLQKEAEKAMADKTRIDAELEDKKKDFAQQEKDKAYIEAAELDADKAKDEKRGRSGNRIEHDELEHISGRPSLIIANDSNRIAKDTNHVLHRIHDKLDKISGRPSHPVAGRY